MSQTPLSKHLLDPAMLDGVLSIEGYLRPSLGGRGVRLKKLASGSRPAGWSSSGMLSKPPSQSGCIEAWTPAWLGACTKGTRNTSTTITTMFTSRASTRRILYGAAGSSTRRQPRLGRRACRGANALDGQCSPRVGTFRVTISFPTPSGLGAPQMSGRLRLASRQGLAIGVGRRSVLVPKGGLSAAGLQYARALQCRAGHGAFRDAGFALRSRQAPRHQRMVDGTCLDGKAGRASAGPDRRWRSANRNLLNIPPS